MSAAVVVRIIEQCHTEVVYDDEVLRFVCRCRLSSGHSGWHLGTADVQFSPGFAVVVEPPR